MSYLSFHLSAKNHTSKTSHQPFPGSRDAGNLRQCRDTGIQFQLFGCFSIVPSSPTVRPWWPWLGTMGVVCFLRRCYKQLLGDGPNHTVHVKLDQFVADLKRIIKGSAIFDIIEQYKEFVMCLWGLPWQPSKNNTCRCNILPTPWSTFLYHSKFHVCPINCFYYILHVNLCPSKTTSSSIRWDLTMATPTLVSHLVQRDVFWSLSVPWHHWWSLSASTMHEKCFNNVMKECHETNNQWYIVIKTKTSLEFFPNPNHNSLIASLETSRIGDIQDFFSLETTVLDPSTSTIKSEIPKPFGHRDQRILRKSVRKREETSKRGRKPVDRNPLPSNKKHMVEIFCGKNGWKSQYFPRICWLLLIFLIHDLFLLSRFDCWGMLNDFGWCVIWACPFSAHSSLEEDILSAWSSLEQKS